MLNIVNEPNFTLQLDLFIPERWPKKPYCTDDLTNGLRIRSLKSAIKLPYIQANPPHLRVWSIFDIDRPGAAFAWDDANLPPPTWTVITTKNGHAHLVWGLSAPVLVDSPDMRIKALRYLCGIEAAFRERLGADPGYSGLITKNPAYPDWHTLTYGGPDLLLYDLDELAEWVDLSKFIPKRGHNPEQIGLGRNVTVFDLLRKWAYKQIRRLESRNYVEWQAGCYARALEFNGDFPTPMDNRECWAIAKSVAKWVYREMSADGWRQWVAKTHSSEIQAKRGRKGGIAKGVANEDKRASARLMRIQGQSFRAIAEALGVSVGSVHSWCSDSLISDNSPRGMGGGAVDG